jgi:hypothetical protein
VKPSLKSSNESAHFNLGIRKNGPSQLRRTSGFKEHSCLQQNLWRYLFSFSVPGADDMIFLNVFAKKVGEKSALFAQTTASFFAKFDHNIGFLEKRQIFRRKSRKILIITSTLGC